MTLIALQLATNVGTAEGARLWHMQARGPVSSENHILFVLSTPGFDKYL